ncbi:hypothetical protein [Silvibacterium dinghuense]|uniref:Uncharacterized protein n=1 Tax=Silvibacterium dinghuense TaxID=1560006 RepID=A0A4V1NVB2_9BACT|nr:hypothetical protein [Silvibacterium dinghuense]RXS95160.1 hypothetical protein ESZ00_11165 [Silvibacterium dinghuense]GGH11189.1 hypothetical protein GCM10011586_29760 [Silvibacterium dinghuense]
MAAAADTSLYRELWISFASLIRSYVAAHDIGRAIGHAFVDEGEDGHLSLRSEQRVLSVDFETATGTGSWALYEEDPGPERALAQGTFTIGEDSLVAFSDRRGRLELEVAAEAFTAKVFDEE